MIGTAGAQSFTVGDVFARAWAFFKRDWLWLILAGIVVGLVVGVVVFVIALIVGGMVALSVGGIAIGTNNSSTSITGVGIGTLVLAFIVGAVGYIIVSLLVLVFQGGMFEMVIGAAKADRKVEFGDLFSGFRKLSSFLVFWLVIVGIGIACAIVIALTFGIGLIAVVPFLLWLGVTWIYVLPLIADQGLTFKEAAGRSRQMVREAGWWKTFGIFIVLWVALVVIGIIIGLTARINTTIYSLLLLVFEVVAGPFVICYLSTMYLDCGGATSAQPATSVWGGAPPALGVPPAPPAPGYSPAVAAPAAGAVAAGAAAGAVAAAPSEAWKQAADPLASAPPAPPLAPPPSAAPPVVAAAAPAVAAAEPHVHTPDEGSPGVDAASGQVLKHCSQCGTVIDGSDEFCQVCALEVSGGTEAPTAAAEAPGDATQATQAAPAPPAPPAPEPPKAPGT